MGLGRSPRPPDGGGIGWAMSARSSGGPNTVSGTYRAS